MLSIRSGVRSSKGLLPNPQPQSVHYFLGKWGYRKLTHGHLVGKRAMIPYDSHNLTF
jgi:hypothetical protein